MVVAWALLSACGRPPADGVSPHETAETGRIDTAPPGDSGDSGDTDAETGDSGGDTAPPPRTDADGDGRADIREGKDVAHRVALSKGGSNKNGVRLEAPSTNRSFKRGSNHKVVSEVSTKERKKK